MYIIIIIISYKHIILMPKLADLSLMKRTNNYVPLRSGRGIGAYDAINMIYIIIIIIYIHNAANGALSDHRIHIY